LGKTPYFPPFLTDFEMIQENPYGLPEILSC
jgi:hypothetical protein